MIFGNHALRRAANLHASNILQSSTFPYTASNALRQCETVQSPYESKARNLESPHRARHVYRSINRSARMGHQRSVTSHLHVQRWRTRLRSLPSFRLLSSSLPASNDYHQQFKRPDDILKFTYATSASSPPASLVDHNKDGPDGRMTPMQRPRASLHEYPDGRLDMRLLLPHLPSSAARYDQGSPVVHKIKLSENKVRVQSVLKSRKKYQQGKKSRETEMRRPADLASIVSTLNSATPFQPLRETPATFYANPLLLKELYLEILNTAAYEADPEPPTSSGGIGQMGVMATESAIGQIQQRLDAKASILRNLASQANVPVASSRDASAPRVPIVSRSRKASAHRQNAREVERPAVWTTLSLLKYITDVTNSRKGASESLASHNRLDAEAILEETLFENPEARSSLSYAAFHRALGFLNTQRRTHRALELAGYMANLGFPPNVQTYNIFLRDSAKQQNFAAFASFLEDMLKLNIQPNAQTWLSLLLAMPTVDAKQFVARNMLEKGMVLARAFARGDAPSFVPISLGPFLDSDGTIKHYIGIMDKLFGEAWLTEPALAAIVAELASRGEFVEAVKAIEFTKSRRGRLSNPRPLHTIIAHCVRHRRNADFVVWLLVWAQANFAPYRLHEHVLYNQLFLLALNTRMYNMARVAWKWAAMTGELKHEMRVKVLQSLRDYTHQEQLETASGQWKASFGAVVCNSTPDQINETTPHAILDSERKLQHAAKPSSPFLSFLVEALVLDKKWSTEGLKKSASIEWKVTNAIRIPIVAQKAPGARLEQ